MILSRAGNRPHDWGAGVCRPISRCFCSLPVAARGKSVTKSTLVGTLKWVMRAALLESRLERIVTASSNTTLVELRREMLVLHPTRQE